MGVAESDFSVWLLLFLEVQMFIVVNIQAKEKILRNLETTHK